MVLRPLAVGAQHALARGADARRWLPETRAPDAARRRVLPLECARPGCLRCGAGPLGRVLSWAFLEEYRVWKSGAAYSLLPIDGSVVEEPGGKPKSGHVTKSGNGQVLASQWARKTVPRRKCGVNSYFAPFDCAPGSLQPCQERLQSIGNIDQSKRSNGPTSCECVAHGRYRRWMYRMQGGGARDYAETLGAPLRVAWRASQLLVLLGTHAALLPVALGALRMRESKRKSVAFMGRMAASAYFLSLCEAMRLAGGAIPKLGQWAATRPDVFPAPMVAALAPLQTAAVAAHSFAATSAILACDVGADAVLSVESAPVGSGTVAQVHRAVLRWDAVVARGMAHGSRPVGLLSRRLSPCFCSAGSTCSAVPIFDGNGCANTGAAILSKASTATNQVNAHTMAPKNALGHKMAKHTAQEEAHPGCVRIPHVHVAVKVRHPGVEKEVADDVRIIRFLALAATAALPSSLRWLGLSREAASFGAMMDAQMDMRAEARALARFCWSFGPWDRAVVFPRPLPGLTTARVLVESDLTSLPLSLFVRRDSEISHLSANSALRRVRRDLAATGARVFLRMLLWNNFVHTDMHPGNLGVRLFSPSGEDLTLYVLGGTGGWSGIGHSIDRRDYNRTGPDRCIRSDTDAMGERLQRVLRVYPKARAQLVILDAGLVASLRWRDAANLRDLVAALVLPGGGGGRAAARLLVERTQDPSWVAHVRDPAGFAAALDDVVSSALRPASQSLSALAQLRVGPVLLRVFALARSHRVHLDTRYAAVLSSLVCVEGVGSQLAPDMAVLPLLVRSLSPRLFD